MLILNKLKIGDIIQPNRTGYCYTILGNPGKFFIANCTPGTHKNEIPLSDTLTYVGDNYTTERVQTKRRRSRSPKRVTVIQTFYGCLYDNKIIYLSQYIMKSFNKIQYKKENK